MHKVFKKIDDKLDPRYFAAFASAVLVLLILASQTLPTAIYLKGKVFSYFSKSPKIMGDSIFRLPVEYHRQEHALSCEIAALKMALNGVGINITESDLLSQLSFDSTPRDKKMWGNPYTGFVGDIDGKMGLSGYGVYWQPIQNIANKYTYSEVIENATPEILAQHLLEGRPIVWWGYFGRGKKISWQTPDGKQIDAVNGEHARTIIGFTGSQYNPSGFILLDPIYGELFWETEELLKNSEPFNNSGVVLYSHDSLFSLGDRGLKQYFSFKEYLLFLFF